MESKPEAADAGQPARALRVDAQRNRDQVLRTAAEVFATEGLSVPVHEIARRAGVGTGTVSRHFPTKEDLFVAVFLNWVKELTERADTMVEQYGASGAFFALFSTLIRGAATNRGLGEGLAGAGFDLEAIAERAGYSVSDRLRGLLVAGQQAGTIRPDITYADAKALMAGCLSRITEDTDYAALDRVITVVCEGLRVRPPA
jgi:AcrR family transcriptional regulator